MSCRGPRTRPQVRAPAVSSLGRRSAPKRAPKHKARPRVAMAAGGSRGGDATICGSRGPNMEDELYLENIDEFVTDQNRVVTYKWLSYTLGVHVNQAKQMLYNYMEKKRKENSGAQLHVTYLLAGNLVQNGHTCHKVAVVKEDKLEAMKSKLSTVASVHVYSIQKALLKDSSPLFNTDYDILKAHLQNCSKYSAIHCAEAVVRTASEGSQPERPAQTCLLPPHSSNAHAAPAVNGQASSASSKQPSQQAKGIMGMFALKSASKSKNAQKEAKLEMNEISAVSVTNSKAQAKENILNNFFGKAAPNKDCTVSPEPEQPKAEKSGAKPLLSFMDPKSAPGHEKPSKKAEPAKEQQKDKKRAKRREEASDEEEKEAGNVKKKRRRIRQPRSESSSNEEDASTSPAVSEDFFPEPAQKPRSSPEPVQVCSGEKKRRRKRVLKSKTFVDDEGCIVTEKAYESESCTESEEEFRTKPTVAPKPPPGATKKEPREEKRSTKKGGSGTGRPNKQTSIMGFFQKK